MKHINIFIIVIACNLLITNAIYSQTILPYMEVIAIPPDYSDKTIHCSNSSNSFTSKYRDLNNADLSLWMPTLTQEIKYIKVNFIIVQREDLNNLGNFSSNGVSLINPNFTDEAFLIELIQRANNLLENLMNPSDNGGYSICGPCNQIKDTCIRLLLTDIRYFQSNQYYGKTYVTNGWKRKDEINILLTGNNSDWSSANMPSLTNHNYFMSSLINRLYQDYITFGPDATFGAAHILLHEIGHNFGLCHTYFGGGCPWSCEEMHSNGFYFDDIFGSYPSNNCPERNFSWNSDPWEFPDDYITNNIMAGTVTRQYFSTKQIAVIHRNLSLYTIRNCVLKDTYDEQNPLIINSDEIWDFDFLTYFDVIINNGATLTITCNLRMPANSRIIVKPGGRLILDGGRITNHLNSFWQGIEVWGTKTASQRPLLNNPNQGIVELKNGAVIENAYVAIRNLKQDDFSSTGGVIICEDAIFRNNKTAVEFAAYRNFNPNNPTQKIPDFSKFKNTKFIVDDEYLGGDDFSAHVRMWDVHGINFVNCEFENNISAPSFYNYPNNYKGIHSIDASYNINGICNLITVGLCADENYTPSTFKGFNYAIMATSSSTNSEIINVFRTDFENNKVGMYASGLHNFSFNKNKIQIGTAQDEHLQGFGIYASGSTGYRIEENEISKLYNLEKTWGISIVNS